MSHTPGPWKIFDGYGSDRSRPAIVDSIPDRDGRCVANCIAFAATTNPEAQANAARIVACVNACEGINPEAVPELLAYIRKHAPFSVQSAHLLSRAEATQCPAQ